MNTMRWNGWGDPERATTLPGPVLDLLLQVLGGSTASASTRTSEGNPAEPPAMDRFRLPDSPLPATSLARLVDVVGPDNVLTAAVDRIHRTRGKSTVDLLRIRVG